MFGLPIEAFVHVKMLSALDKKLEFDFRRLIYCGVNRKTITLTKGHPSKQEKYSGQAN